MNSWRAGGIALLAIFLAALATAPTVQHHPFSQIFPSDQDLNFGEYDAFNMTEVNLANGAIFTGNVVRNAGRSIDIIRYLNTGNVEIPNGNLDLKGNNITSSSGGEICVGEYC